MKGRKQKISGNNYLHEDRAELENRVGVQTFMWIDETEDTEGVVNIGLLEQVVSPQNLNRAYRQVVINRGSGGIDKMEVTELKSYLSSFKPVIRAEISIKQLRISPWSWGARCTKTGTIVCKRRLYLCRRYRLGKVLRHGQPQQTDRVVITNDKRRTSYLPDTQISECRSYGRG